MRTSILDWTLLIGQLCCLYDHLGEEEMNLLGEKDSVNEGDLAVILSIDEDLAYLKQEQESILNQRREMQGEMFRAFGIDKENWCKFKHYATALAVAQECSDADPQNNELHNELIRMRKLTYRFLGRITGGEPAECGRCLADVIEKKEAVDKEEVEA